MTLPRAQGRSASLYVEHEGCGPPLVMLHGWALNLRVFDGLAAALAATHTVIRIDLPGHGASGEAAGLRECGWTAAALAAEIAPHVPPRATLLGWSLGAQIALELAAHGPETVSALVLISATPRFIVAPESQWQAGIPPARLEQLASFLRRDPRTMVRDFLELQVRGSRAGERTLHELRHALEAHGLAEPGALERGLEMLRREDLRERLAALARVPTLLLAGQYDRVTPPAAARALHAALPRSLHLELPRAGHAPFLSHHEEVATRVREFLRDVPDPAAAAATPPSRSFASS